MYLDKEKQLRMNGGTVAGVSAVLGKDMLRQSQVINYRILETLISIPYLCHIYANVQSRHLTIYRIHTIMGSLELLHDQSGFLLV